MNASWRGETWAAALDGALGALRDGDPDPAAAAGATERVLARLALLRARHGSRSVRSRPLRRALGRLAAVAALLALAWLPLGAPPRTAEVPRRDPWAARLERAAAGDVLARRQVELGGRAARAALLARIEAGQGTAAELAWLFGRGLPLAAAEAERLAALALGPRAAAAALAALGRDAGPHGLKQLEALADAQACPGPALARALGAQGRGGRTEVALRALLKVQARGCAEAAREALALAGAERLASWLEALPPERPDEETLCAALRAAPSTVQVRLLRLAERGHPTARHLGAAAGLAVFTGWLSDRVHEPVPATAVGAGRGLLRIGTPAAHLALARALDGPAGAHLEALVPQIPAPALAAALAQARRSWRDTAAALRLLAAHPGAHGALWEAIAREPRWAPRAVALLGPRRDAASATWLAAIAAAGGAARADAVQALGVRARAGDAAARAALETLREGPHGRPVRALLGEPGTVAPDPEPPSPPGLARGGGPEGPRSRT